MLFLLEKSVGGPGPSCGSQKRWRKRSKVPVQFGFALRGRAGRKAVTAFL